MASAPASLCTSCVFVRLVHGRRGQTYLMCRNEAIKAKYLPQPVVQCHGYTPEGDAATRPRTD